MEQTYKVPEANLATLQVRIAKLARRCTRIKVQPPVLTVGAPIDIRIEDEINGARILRSFPVTINSVDRPKIDGFEFAAVISPVTDEDGKHLGNILRMVPGFEGQLPERYREATNHCDHCNTERRRLETFVIQNKYGLFMQVGRNCLANYLGLTNPHQLAELAQILIDAEDLMGMSEGEGFGGQRVAERVPIDELLQLTASAIRQYGWLSNKSAREFEKTSTSSRVQEWIFGGIKTREAFEHPLTITDEDRALATETEAWLEAITDTSNDYLYNLSLLAKATSVTGKNFGLVCSSINAYSRDKERAIRRNARIESDSKSQFVGTIGERITIENAIVVYTTEFSSDFGVTHFYKMKSGDNLFVYFSSTKMFEQGETIPSMSARVKKHEARPDKYDPLATAIRQTVITRATLPKPPKPPLTPEQKIAKKAIKKLRSVQRTLPNSLNACKDGQDYDDYLAWNTMHELIWEIQKEHKV